MVGVAMDRFIVVLQCKLVLALLPVNARRAQNNIGRTERGTERGRERGREREGEREVGWRGCQKRLKCEGVRPLMDKGGDA